MNPTRTKFQTTAANCRRRVCALVKALPEGRHGWIGVWLDSPEPDWAEIQELIENACHLSPTVPRTKDRLTTINST